MQQTIVGGCVHILSWNVVYSVSLKACWELCIVCQIWASLSYIYKSIYQQTSLLHSEQKEQVER